jgi:hypothetical protein
MGGKGNFSGTGVWVVLSGDGYHISSTKLFLMLNGVKGLVLVINSKVKSFNNFLSPNSIR